MLRVESGPAAVAGSGGDPVMRTIKLALVLLLATCAWSVAASASAAPRPLPPLTPPKHDALFRALERGQLSESQYALQRARSLFALDRVRAEFGHVARADPRSATFVLRDLLARTRFLTGAERAQAKAILSRPDGVPTFFGEPSWDFDAIPQSECEGGRPLCFHWDDNPTNGDSPPAADTNPSNGIPDQIDRTIAVLDNVWDTETGALGYRQPLDDSATTVNDGGGPELDIYFADIGSIGLFGYCTSDDPQAFTFSAPWAVSAYCVLDDDYSQAQYGFGQTPQEFLEVTAAHEFFHAVQFAYDWFEDIALMEGTAMWMEGEVYPDVIDRINYLNRSALSRPGVPLDTGARGFEYGSWLFWRFLSEKVFANDPTIVRDIWERADGGPSPVFGDEYSFKAVRRALAANGHDFRSTFARFGWTNDLRDYSEADLGYPVVPLAGKWHLGSNRFSTGWQTSRLRHLATGFYRLRPAKGAPQDAELHLNVDLPGPATNPAATAVVYTKTGPREVHPIALDGKGNGHIALDFGSSQVWKVDLVLSNGSLRFNCPAKDFPESVYSCGGLPKDDFRSYRFRARLTG
jgi:hypothetical protein